MNSYVPSGLLGLSLDVVRTFTQALTFCAKKLRRPPEEVLQLLARGDSWVHSTFRYALVNQICQYLSRLGTVVRSVYIYGSCMEDRARPCSDVDIIIWVNEKSDALVLLLERLNYLISDYYRALMGDKAEGMARMLDIHLVDDREVEAREGYGAVLSSPYTSPVRIWSR
jgi:predicted nucleotidyltransferase